MLCIVTEKNGKRVIKIKLKIAQAKTAFVNKKNLLCFNNLYRGVKKRLIKVYLWSVLLYVCEVWALNRSEKNILKIFEM